MPPAENATPVGAPSLKLNKLDDFRGCVFRAKCAALIDARKDWPPCASEAPY